MTDAYQSGGFGYCYEITVSEQRAATFREVEAYAEAQRISRNRAILDLVRRGLAKEKEAA